MARSFDLTEVEEAANGADTEPGSESGSGPGSGPGPDSAAVAAVEGAARMRRILVLGWSHKGPALLSEFDSYPRERFDIDVLSTVPREDRELALGRHGLQARHIRLEHIAGDYTASSDLRRCEPARYDHVIFLANDRLEAGEESDARTILGYLLLREIIGGAAQPHVLIELLDPGNVSLFRRRAGEVLISPLILSHMLAQVALRRELRAVFDELFGPGGAEIYFNPPARYGLERREIPFRDVQRAVALRGEIALGVRHVAADRDRATILLNPSREQRWMLGTDDEIIVLSTDPR